MIGSYPFPKKRGDNLVYILLILALLLLSRDTLLARNLLGFQKSQVLQFILVAAVGIFFLVLHRKRLPEILKDGRMAAAGFCLLAVLLPMICKRDFQLMYFSILFYALAGILLSYIFSLDRICRYYLLILSGLSIYALVCTYGLRILPDRGIIQVPLLVNDNGVEFYNFGLCQVSISYVKNRNFGVFREPGVYQFFLLLGLYLNNYRADFKKNWQVWTVNCILALTMLSTFATGGVIEMGLLGLFLFVDKKLYQKTWGRILAGTAVLTVGGAIGWILITKNSLYADLVYMVEKFWTTPPSESRFLPILLDGKIFLQNPLFGEKLGAVLELVENNTTTTMVLLAGMGLLMGILHTAGWLALCWERKRNVFLNLFLLLILFMSFNTQNLSGNLMFWLFPMMALCQRGLPLFAKKRK